MEPADSRNGTVTVSGTVGVCACGGWLLAGHFVFAGLGPDSASSAHEQQQGRGAGKQPGEAGAAGAGGDASQPAGGNGCGRGLCRMDFRGCRDYCHGRPGPSLGIAIQNFPEGAIISMPLGAEGVSRRKAFLYGALSGVVEPVGAGLTMVAAGLVVPLLPYLLSFAAGAMVYVVVEELIPEMSAGKHSNVGTVLFAAGFTIMMALDVALG